jgi:glycine/D-amino acid oxidase-like deaminating enzyme
VEQVAKISAGWQAQTSLGTIAAREILVATNGYTGATTPLIQRRIVPVGSYIIATEPLSESQAAALLPRRRMAFDSKHFVYYFRVTSDRRLLFGGRAEFTQPDAQSVRRAAAVLRRGMTKIFPDLASVRVDYAWGGNVAFTRDQLPHAGLIGGLYVAGGYGGHGIALATALGDLIARRIAGAPVENPLLDTAFPTIPFYRGTPWFLPFAGAYYKVKDWIS